MHLILHWLKLAALSIALLFTATGIAALISNYDLSLKGGLPLFLFLFGSLMVGLAIWRPNWCGLGSEDKVGSAKEVLLMGNGLLLASVFIFLAGEKMIFASVVGGIGFAQLFRNRAETVVRTRMKNSEPSKD